MQRAGVAQQQQRIGERASLRIFARSYVQLQDLAVYRSADRQSTDIDLRFFHLRIC
jgi:hypothetical protein